MKGAGFLVGQLTSVLISAADVSSRRCKVREVTLFTVDSGGTCLSRSRLTGLDSPVPVERSDVNHGWFTLGAPWYIAPQTGNNITDAPDTGRSHGPWTPLIFLPFAIAAAAATATPSPLPSPPPPLPPEPGAVRLAWPWSI